MTIGRRELLTGAAATMITSTLASCAASIGGATSKPGVAVTPGVAITVDDFALGADALHSGSERDRRIRETLARYGLKAAGFVAGKNIDVDIGPGVLSAWSREGHLLGNHSYSHARYEGEDPAGAMVDILRCEALLSPYPTYAKLFRFPYLAEGRTAEGRDRLRALLREHGYRNGHVTIDASDWYIAGRLQAKLNTDPRANLAPYRHYYLDHIWERATYYDDLAIKHLGGSIGHTLLLHHNLTTALFLGDLLTMFERRGWRLLDASNAFAAPVFALEFDTLPAGQSLLWAAAKARGGADVALRYPAEDGRYEKPRMDALGL